MIMIGEYHHVKPCRLLFLCVLTLWMSWGVFGDEIPYFPSGLTDPRYSDILRRMAEPSLYKSAPREQAYRFLWLRTFDNPVAVRIQKERQGATLRAVRLNGASGYEIGKIDVDRTLPISEEQWNAFVKLLDAASFWGTPSGEKGPEIGFDGAHWVIEGRSGENYHLVDRWSPLTDRGRSLQNFVRCCDYLLRLSRMEIPEGKRY